MCESEWITLVCQQRNWFAPILYRSFGVLFSPTPTGSIKLKYCGVIMDGWRKIGGTTFRNSFHFNSTSSIFLSFLYLLPVPTVLLSLSPPIYPSIPKGILRDRRRSHCLLVWSIDSPECIIVYVLNWFSFRTSVDHDHGLTEQWCAVDDRHQEQTMRAEEKKKKWRLPKFTVFFLIRSTFIE